MQCTATDLGTAGWHGSSGPTGRSHLWVCPEGTRGTVAVGTKNERGKGIGGLSPRARAKVGGTEAEGGSAGVPWMSL